MSKITVTCLILVGLINFVPVLGLLSVQNIESAYKTSLTDPNLIILMRHRALLFGVLGGFVLSSVFKPVYQNAAMVMAGISMVGFVLLTLIVGDFNEAIYKVFLVDIVAMFILVVAVLIKFVLARK